MKKNKNLPRRQCWSLLLVRNATTTQEISNEGVRIMKKLFAISFLIFAAVCFAKAERPPLKVSVEPTEGEFVVFMPAAAKSSQQSTMGQIALV